MFMDNILDESKYLNTITAEQIQSCILEEYRYYHYTNNLEIQKTQFEMNLYQLKTTFDLDLEIKKEQNEIGYPSRIPYLNGNKMTLQELEFLNKEYSDLKNHIQERSIFIKDNIIDNKK